MAFLWKHPESKFWMARFYDVEGRRRNRSTRIEAKEKNRKQAMKVAEAFEEAATRQTTARHVRRVIVELHKEIVGESLPSSTVAEHVERWLTRKKGATSPATYAFYRTATSKFLGFLGERAGRDIAEVTRDDITAFRDAEAGRVAAKTANHSLKCVRMLFKDAMRDHLIEDNPTEFVEVVRAQPTAKLRPFTLAELRAVLSVADDEWQSMIYFGLYTGQRIGDIATLTWQNIDTVRNEVRLVTKKTGRRQIIPIPSPLLRHIESLPATDDPTAPLHPRAFAIVENQGKSGSLSNQFGDLLAQAGLREKVSHRARQDGNARRRRSPLTFHSLRRTATSFLHEGGVPAAVAKELVGHDSDEIHEVYVSIGDSALRDAAEKLGQFDVVG